MITQIKNHGGSMVLVLNREYIKFHDLKIGDWVSIDKIIKIKKGGVKKNEMA